MGQCQEWVGLKHWVETPPHSSCELEIHVLMTSFDVPKGTTNAKELESPSDCKSEPESLSDHVDQSLNP